MKEQFTLREKFTLWKLLNSINVLNFDSTKKLTICSTSGTSLMDRLNADISEFYIDDIPFNLLKKEVYSVNYYENSVVVLNRKVGKKK